MTKAEGIAEGISTAVRDNSVHVVFLQRSTVPVLWISIGKQQLNVFSPTYLPPRDIVTAGTAQISTSRSGSTSGNHSPPLQLRPAVIPGS